MTTTTQVHAMDNEMTFKADRLWEGVDNRPAYGNDTILIKVGVPELGWQATLFINGDDATLFKLQGQLRDLADQVEEMISPDAMIVEYANVGEQDGEGM